MNHMFDLCDMKTTSNKDVNSDLSWKQTQAYAIGHQVNESNERLIHMKQDEGASTTVSLASPAHSSSYKSNWNTLRILFDGDNIILTEKGIQMLKANTNSNEGQIRQWHADILRDCPNGKLSKDRFVAVYEQLYPGGKAKDFCTYAFATFDRDNIGTINLYEFMLSIGLTQSNDLDLRFALAFDMHNYSYSNSMDANELAKAISTLYDLIGETNRKGDRDPKHRAEEIVRIGAVSDNKKLTKTEFIAQCKNDPIIRYLRAIND